MDGQEYLSRISEDTKPKKAAKKSGILGILQSKIFLIIAGAMGAIVLLAIIGGIISGSRGSVKNDSIALQLHLANTIEVLGEYQNEIKDSKLRSDAASLAGVMSNTNSALLGYLEGKYEYKESKADKTLQETAEASGTELSTELFEAKINGILDRIIAQKMAYEIEMFVAEEDSILRATSDENLKAILEESMGSLDNLYENFNEFSEGA